MILNICSYILLLSLIIRPNQLSITFHARIDELADVVSPIGPLELPLTIYSRIFQTSTIDKGLSLSINARGEVFSKDY